MLNSCATFGDEIEAGNPVMGEMPSPEWLIGPVKKGSSMISRFNGLSEGMACGECRAAIVLVAVSDVILQKELLNIPALNHLK